MALVEHAKKLGSGDDVVMNCVMVSGSMWDSKSSVIVQTPYTCTKKGIARIKAQWQSVLTANNSSQGQVSVSSYIVKNNNVIINPANLNIEHSISVIPGDIITFCLRIAYVSGDSIYRADFLSMAVIEYED